MFALLLWSLLSSIALFAGAAVCAQLEFLRAGRQDPVHDDPGRPPTTSCRADPVTTLTGVARWSQTASRTKKRKHRNDLPGSRPGGKHLRTGCPAPEVAR